MSSTSTAAKPLTDPVRARRFAPRPVRGLSTCSTREVAPHRISHFVWMAKLKLYQSNASPNSRRVRIYLAEKGISMPIVPVDLAPREQFSDAYAGINPPPLFPR